ncbi:hypothetical protein ENSA5_26850 [Enhygromyxa salina]|uniref:Uncharacterized protein n=1 Tax=Enhygromyxa salina TaxID=215803 RepID=A0A2S9Y877_9BACT|nr:hypothetical protein [Enhygromyxa salina]PRQ01314.1 hypothetical protein ENSA5_26850 [Enhygromyxa salina]
MKRCATDDPRRWPTILLGLAALGLAAAGAWNWSLAPRRAAAREAAAPKLVAARDSARALAASRGLALRFDDARAELRFEAPRDCVEVYRVRVDEHFRDASVATFVGRDEEHSTWLLALAPRAGGRARGLAAVEGLLISLSSPDEHERRRQLWWSASAIGPAAPDFACRRRSWDPLEDALALGWPALPGRSARVGEAWQGAAVEGRCHETTCVDDQGRFPHDRPCRARAWREQLAGAGEGLALIRSDWDDGHDPERPEIGILTSRELVLDEGRPLHVRATVDHRWSGVRRELELERLDDCGARTLASEDDAPAVARIRARLSPP